MHPAVSNGAYDVARSARISRSCRCRSTASRWSISTTPPRRRSRRRCSTASSRPTPPNTPTCTAGCTISPTPRPRPTRARARRCARSSTRRAREEIIFTRNATEAINLVAYTFGRERIKAGRRDRALDHGAPFQHRAVAFPARAPGRGDQMGAGRRRRQFPARRIREAADAAHQDGRDHPHVERARHRRAGQGGGEARARARHSGAGRRQPGARCISTSTCRTSAAISTSSPATSSTARPASACSRASTSMLAAMPPFNGGGEMIREVSEDRVTYGEPPHRFEAGTPPIVQAIGLGAAIDYVDSIGKARIRAHEAELVELCARAAARDQFAAHLSARAKDKGADRVVRDEGRASARRRDRHRPRRRRGARRHPLRACRCSRASA